MPGFFRAIGDELRNRVSQKDTGSVNRFEGFQSNGAVVVRDRRGTLKAEIPNVSEKSETLGSDPMAIYKPSGAKSVDAAKAMGNFTGWTYAAVNAIASEVANIQFRLYQINGDDHEEQDDHPLLTLLEGVNETMTGIELKYTIMAHLELTGNFYRLAGWRYQRHDPAPRHLPAQSRPRAREAQQEQLPVQDQPLRIHHRRQSLSLPAVSDPPHQIPRPE